MSHCFPLVHWLQGLCVLLVLGFAALAEEPAANESVDAEHAAQMAQSRKIFQEQVRGVLVGRCLECHGGEATESELDISTREALLRGGAEGKAIVAGNAKKSRLVDLITHKSAPEMPFEEAKLAEGEIAAIVKWIDLGAAYDKPLTSSDDDETPWTERVIDPADRTYWAFQPLHVAEPPAVKNGKWCRTPIDHFALAKLEAEKLSPNPTADPRTIVRRTYFDLIGLPPTPQEMADWTARLNSPQREERDAALSQLVDHLLDSPHYGERWGRHWLDVARFAESHGFEQDYDRPHAYHYRDFVIKALNDDMPYDQFIRWQLAGDEIAPENPLAMMATGFLGAGVFPTQLTEKEFESARYDELDDMVGTLGTAMLGLTIGCARCHDHKFDPIPQADYYRMVATFATTIRSEIDLNLATPEQLAAAKQNYEQQLAQAMADLEQFEQEQLPAKFAEFIANAKNGPLKTSPWSVLDIASRQTAHGTKFEKQADGSLLKIGDTPAKDTYTLVARSSEKKITAIRLESLTHPSFPHGGPGLAGNGNFCLSDLHVAARAVGSGQPPAVIKVIAARATHQQNQSNLSVNSSFDGDAAATGWAVDSGGIGKDQAAVFIFDEPVGFEAGTEFTVTLRFDHPNTKHAIGRPRLGITTADAQQVAIRETEKGIPAAVADIVRRLSKDEQVKPDDREMALRWFASTLPEFQKRKSAVDNLRTSGPVASGAAKVKVMVCSEGLPKMKHHADGRGFPHFYPESYYLKRGDVNQKQGAAESSYLQVLMRSRKAASGERKLPESALTSASPTELAKTWRIEPPSGSRTSYRRRSLSNWITDTDRGAGHLLARVIVNRVWHLHFGRGLVPTPNDFGVQGEAPSHPELLDWLASDFIEHGWKLKRLHKQILTSGVYLQSADFDAAKAKIDPDNKLLWRYTPRRLEAEVIRDSMLAVSGQLDPTMFGKGTLDEGMKRRSIYFFIKRSKLIPMMQLFDQPEPLVSQGNRPATTIAPQALLFMNNPHVRGYARGLAQRIAPAADESLDAIVRRGYLMAISREPTEQEAKDNIAFLEQQIASYEAEKKPDARNLALVDFCQVLFSLNEFVFVE